MEDQELNLSLTPTPDEKPQNRKVVSIILITLIITFVIVVVGIFSYSAGLNQGRKELKQNAPVSLSATPEPSAQPDKQRTFEVNGMSMSPNYYNGEHYYVDTMSEVKSGDVILYHSPLQYTAEIVGRVIGTPGDVMLIRNGEVYVDGIVLNESEYKSQSVTTEEGSFLKENTIVKVPSQEYFVLGDNRTASSDSRTWGFLPAENVIGKVLDCYKDCGIDAEGYPN